MAIAPRDPASARGRAWRCQVHGGFLAFALVWFQLERLVITLSNLRFAVTPAELLAELLPELGVALVFEAGWLLLAWSKRPWAVRLWRALFLPAHVVLYVVLILDQQFFLDTGSRASPDLVAYAVRNLLMLHGVLAQGPEPGLMFRFLFTPVWLVAAEVAIRRLPARLVPPRGAAVCGLGAGLLFAVGVPSVLTARVNSSLFVEALHGHPERRYLDARARLAPASPIYRAPRIASIARRPSILVVILESVGARMVPPWSPRETWDETPALAALAATGVVVESAYVSVPHSSKSLASLLTGMYPRPVMPIVEANEGDLPLAGLPRLLRGLGYRTAYMQTAPGDFEKWTALVRNLGFEQVVVQEDLDRTFESFGYLGMDEFAMLEPALSWIGEEPGRPFFLTLHTVSTHHPYDSPGSAGSARAADPRAAHRQALAHTDRFLDALLDGLRRSGRLGETLLVVAGDHGEAFGEHGLWIHDAVPYEEGTRVPLLLWGPSWVGGPRRIGGLRHQVDVVPTLLEVLGARFDGVLPGKSLLAADGHERVVTSCYYAGSCVAMREGSRKVVYHYDRVPTEVFDLDCDPDEREDLAPGMPAREVRAAEERMFRFLSEVDGFYDRYPLGRGGTAPPPAAIEENGASGRSGARASP